MYPIYKRLIPTGLREEFGVRNAPLLLRAGAIEAGRIDGVGVSEAEHAARRRIGEHRRPARQIGRGFNDPACVRRE